MFADAYRGAEKVSPPEKKNTMYKLYKILIYIYNLTPTPLYLRDLSFVVVVINSFIESN